MAELRFVDPKNTEQFAALMADCGVLLPVSFSDDNPREIVDATGDCVCVIDVDHLHDYPTVLKRAAWIVTAINTCGGFRALASGTR